MSLDSYKLTRQYSYSNPRKEMLREKKLQVHSLYEFAMDREDDTLLNGKSFIKSPRIFDRKFVDSVHHKITVETILQDDWMECGDYLEFDGMMWLCLNSYSFHKLYCRATFMSCDWQIYWIDEKGELKSQYVIDQNSTQYNSGESGNTTMTLGAAQHMLKMACTEDTIKLDSSQRFAIDRNIKNPTCYRITQNDNTSYNYGKGLCCITVTETQLDIDKDKLIKLEDGKQVWVCDYISMPSSQNIITNKKTSAKIYFEGNQELKIGGSVKVINGCFYDANGSPTTDIGTWEIITIDELKPYIEYYTQDNELRIKVHDNDFRSGKVRIRFSKDSLSTYLDFNMVNAL